MAVKLVVSVKISGNESAKKVLDDTALSAKKVGDAIDKNTKSTEEGARATEKAGKATEDAGAATEKLGRTTVQTTAKVSIAGDTWKEKLIGVWLQYSAINTIVSRVSMEVDRFYSATVGQANILEKGIASMSTLIEGTSDQIKKLTQDALRLQATYGTGLGQITQSYYDALSSGAVDAAGATQFLEAAQKLAIGGSTELNEVIKGLTSVLNAYNLGVDKTARISDLLFIAAKRGATNIKELSNEMGNGAAIARASGARFEEYLAAVAAIGNGGVSTAVAVTQVVSAIQGLSNQTPKMKDSLRTLGIESVQAAIKQKGLIEVLKLLMSTTHGTSEELNDLFGRKEAVAAVTALTSKGVGDAFKGILSEMQDASGRVGEATDAAFSKMAATADFKMNIMKANVSGAFTEMGMAMKSVFGGMAEDIGAFALMVTDSIRNVSQVIERIDFTALAKELGTFIIILGVTSGAFAVLTGSVAIATEAMVGFIGTTLIASYAILSILAPAIAIYLALKNLSVLGEAVASMFKRFEVVVYGVEAALLRASRAIQTFFGNTDMADAFSKSIEEVDAKITTLLKDIQESVKKQNEGFDWGFLNLPAQMKEALAKAKKEAENFNTAFVGPVKPRGVGEREPGKPGLTFEQEQKRLAATQEIEKKIQELRSKNGDELVGQVTKEMLDIKLIQERLAKEGIKIDAEAGKLRAEIMKSYRLKAVEEIQKLYQTETEKAATALQERIAKLDEELKAGLIKEEAYQQARFKLGQTFQIDTLKRQFDTDAKLADLELMPLKALQDRANASKQEYQKMYLDGNMTAQQLANALTAIDKKTATDKEALQLQSALSQAQAAGETHRVIELQAEQELLAQKKLLDEKLINVQEYEKAKAEIERKEAAAKIQTSGSSSTDATLGKITSVVSAAQSGFSSIVSSVGSMFGPWGVLISTLINFFNQTPAQFYKMINGLIDAALKAPEQIMKNIPMLIEIIMKRLPEILKSALEAGLSHIPVLLTNALSAAIAMLPQLINTLLSPNFWIGIAKNMFAAMKQAFKNFWNVLFHGKALDDPLAKIGDESTKKVQFGPNSNAGDAQFQVRDLTAGKQAEGFEQRLDTAVDSHEKGFFDYLNQAWTYVRDQIWKPFWDLIGPIFKAAWVPIEEAWTTMWNLAKLSWDLLIIGLTTAWNVGSAIFKATWDTIVILWKGTWDLIGIIWNGMVNTFKATWDLCVAAFNGAVSILKAVWDIAVAAFQGVINIFKSTWDLCVALFKAPIQTLQAVWEFAKKVFTDPIAAFQGLWTDLQNIWGNVFNKIGNLGTTIWNAFVNVFTKFDNLGTVIWNAFVKVFDKLGTIGTTIWDSFSAALSKGASVIASVGTRMFDGLKSAFDSGIQGLKNIFTRIFTIEPSKGTVEDWLGIDLPWIKFAQGGQVPGTAAVAGNSYANDKVPALLSPGEYVIPRSLTQNPALMKVIEALRQGKPVPMMADGGFFSKIGSAILTTGFGVSEKVHDAFDDLSGTAKDVFSFLQGIGANVDKSNFIAHPINESLRAFQSVITQFFQPKASGIVQGILGSNRFAYGGPVLEMNAGGIVPGSGYTDSVPAMLTPGEMVIPRDQVAQAKVAGGGNTEVHLHFNIHPMADLSERALRNEVVPKVIDVLNRESRNGKSILSPKGVY